MLGSSDEDDEATVTEEALSGPVVDRRTTLSLLSAAGLSGLAGCAGDDGGEPTETTADEDGDTTTATPSPTEGGASLGGTLQAGWFTGSIDNLDPPYISDQKIFPVMANVFNGLVWLDDDLTIRGDLATDWSVTNGGKTFTFDLEEGVTFHNGAEFTAEDVRYTIDRTISKETPAAPKLEPLEPVEDGGVVIQGEYSVQLNFETAFAPALIYLTRGPGRAATVVSKEAIEEMGADQYNVTPVGTGPFEVTEHKIGNTLMLEAYDDYFKTDGDGNTLPYLDAVEISPVPDPSSIVNALRGGDIDFASAVPLQKVTDVEDATDVSVVRMPGVNFSGLSLNNEREPFTSKKVRQGIAKLVDNESFVEDAFFGNGLPDTGPINKGTEWVWREDKPSDQDYAPEEGKQMLEAEGAASASFEITTTKGGLRSAKVIRQQLNSHGLNVEINQVTAGTFGDLLFESGFDATIIGSGGDPDPDQSLYNFFRLPDEDGVWNFMNYRNQEVHDMLGQQRRQLERSERKTTLQAIEDQLIKDVPFAFLYHGDDIAGKHARVKGFERIPGLRYFETVWLEQ